MGMPIHWETFSFSGVVVVNHLVNAFLQKVANHWIGASFGFLSAAETYLVIFSFWFDVEANQEISFASEPAVIYYATF